MLSPERRISSAEDFKRVYAEGKGIRGRFLTLRFAEGRGEKTRFGLAPARKIKSAVLRNRAKRRLREICRAYLDEIKDSFDVVINIKKEAVDASFEDLKKDFLSVMRRAGLLK
ncbi:MAG: ribonuclease P protein component [Thermacetogeniaceae bacterium]